MSLCDQMVEFVNLCPLGQDRKKGSIKNKTINGVLKWPSNVSNKTVSYTHLTLPTIYSV